ncbi:MAG: MHYT domain-containing protein [Nostoc sp. CmiVER01]|uniref:MHYT domain-containing protein n=1 Tax=Nostoc sp. CmiVER01 TaxID=3075384 RepID=UPI002AD49648|nr:MHYT domain-containing protein [Nostoc sp. CmiVER01]MDZ8125815.1 MHYT domain-containing protein [Nostoc sp. CmiVER01]
MLHGIYDIRLTLFSVAIAMLTAYTTLDLAIRVTDAKSHQKWRWLVGGAIAMGIGIWAMHFIAMLAFSLAIPIYYDWLTVLMSVLPAIFASGLALYLVSQPEFGILRLFGGSILMGAGISAMHYIGMAAIRLPAKMSYDLSVVALSIAIAILISLVALWVGFNLRANSTVTGRFLRIGSAILMGAAIPSMHYTGMMATHFSVVESVEFSEVDTTATYWMAAIIGLFTLLLLGWTLITSFFNEQLSVQLVKTADLKENEERLKQALQNQEALAALSKSRSEKLETAMLALQQAQLQFIQAEKMSSLGQMVAGVAHEINNPANFIYGNLFHTEIYLRQLLELINIYQQYYPTPVLAVQAQVESIDLPFLLEDLPKLLKSMQAGANRIKYIVESLRNFSRLDEAQLKAVDIHEGLNSTLLILQNRISYPLNNRPEIIVMKEYGNLPLVNCYAGQLNQVFFNIITNAIDVLEEKLSSLKSNSSFTPLIRIKTTVSQIGWINIQIFDNGFGISKDVQNKIYDPFFTTKQVGQGSGLGLSISYQIVVKTHGGKLNCISAKGQGATFQIELPIDRLIDTSCFLGKQSEVAPDVIE